MKRARRHPDGYDDTLQANWITLASMLEPKQAKDDYLRLAFVAGAESMYALMRRHLQGAQPPPQGQSGIIALVKELDGMKRQFTRRRR